MRSLIDKLPRAPYSRFDHNSITKPTKISIYSSYKPSTYARIKENQTKQILHIALAIHKRLSTPKTNNDIIMQEPSGVLYKYKIK